MLRAVSFFLAFTFLSSCSSMPVKDEAQKVVHDAAQIVRSLRSGPNAAYINPLLEKAKGVIVFPNLYEAGFIIGGETGSGVILAKDNQNAWSPPAFLSLSNVSLGFQAGAKNTGMLVVLMTDKALSDVLSKKGFEFSGGAAGNFGSSGGEVEFVSSDNKDVRYFFQPKSGTFAGVSMKGVTMMPKDSLNYAYYNTVTTPRQIVLDRRLYNPKMYILTNALRVN